MCDVDPDILETEKSDNSCVKINEDETPSSSNLEPELAGSIEIEDEPDEKAPESPRGAKRRLSCEENGDEDAVKRVASEDKSCNDNNVVDSTNDIGTENDSNKNETAKEIPTDSDNVPTQSENDAKEAAKKSAPEVVIEISDDSSDSDICAVDSYQASAAELKRIRGDNYSSSSDYSSDSSSSSGEDDSVVLPTRRQRLPVASRARLEPRALRTDLPKLNKDIVSPDSTDKLSAHWAQSKEITDENITFIAKPFKVCLLHNVLQNGEIINNIVDDMNTLDWTRKKMDLYEFHQTTDLANLTWQRSIRGIYDLLKNDAMPWVSRVTGAKLTHISASCSLYGPGDHLLVHDDMLGDRRVAFILYLAPWSLRAGRHNGDDTTKIKGWSEAMGGALELFDCDEDKQPSKAARSVVPQNNMLAFFEVSPVSFHQVTEVLSLEFPRLSINGWFHGPGQAEAAAEEPERAPPVACKPHTEVVLAGNWMTSQYLSPRTRLQIQQQMEKASEISLQTFFTAEKYEAVVQALAGDDAEWKWAGPADQRRYETLQLERLEPLERAHPLRELLKLFTSSSMYRFLHDCTDLTIQSHFDMEVQRWRANCYTVLPPKEHYAQNQLDVVMYLALPARALCGGVITYVAPEDESVPPLVSLEPRNNALNLVYADAQTARFTKHVSSRTLRPDEFFYMLTCSYREQAA